MLRREPRSPSTDHGRLGGLQAKIALFVLVVVASATVLVAPLRAQRQPRQLKEPHEIAAQGGTLSTQLRIEMKKTSFEQWKKNEKECFVRDKVEADLRMYGYPNPGGNTPGACRGEFCYGFPGPTFRMSKTDGTRKGDVYKMTLMNGLPKGSSDEKCSAGGKEYDWDKHPNCFHGENVTNFHFHGFHVSPNPNANGTYQDYIFLKLFPESSSQQASFPEQEVGKARFELSALPADQGEGTHWYHPHKHGSTAVQVGNGMAGAFVIDGPYDRWLEQQVCRRSDDPDCHIEERLLVIQEMLTEFRFPPPNDYVNISHGDRLVNGQLYPTIDIEPGEVQRWRVLNATMKASSAFHLIFPAELAGGCGVRGECIKQIGMDGIPFVKENYVRQPLLGKWDADAKSCHIATVPTKTDGSRCILMHPGNRADFLVRGPEKAQAKKVRRLSRQGRLEMGSESMIEKKEFFSEGVQELRQSLPRLAFQKPTNKCPHPDKPGLFNIDICKPSRRRPCKLKRMVMPDVGTYPKLEFLDDIARSDRERQVPYKITGYTNARFRNPYERGTPEHSAMQKIRNEVGDCKYLAPRFTIDDRQFGKDVDYFMKLGSAEKWTFPNQSAAPTIPADTSACPKLKDFLTEEDCPGGKTPCLKVDETVLPIPTNNVIQHPVHLHVNPFQVLSDVDGRKPGKPFVWQDVVGLHTAGDGGGATQIISKFLKFKGDYVMHCHILGHEDRGMMQRLRVCADGDPKYPCSN